MTTAQGIKFHESDGESITSVFGYTEGQFLDLCHGFKNFFIKDIEAKRKELEEAEQNGRRHQFLEELEKSGEGSLTGTLARFLESDEFKKIGIELKTPNSYVLIGYMFRTVVSTLKKAERAAMHKDMPQVLKDLLQEILED